MIKIKDKAITFKILPKTSYHTCKYKIFLLNKRAVVFFYGFRSKFKYFIKKVIPELANKLVSNNLYDYETKDIVWMIQIKEHPSNKKSGFTIQPGIYSVQMKNKDSYFSNAEIISINYDFEKSLKLIKKANEYLEKAVSIHYLQNTPLEDFVRAMAVMPESQEVIKEKHNIREGVFFDDVLLELKERTKENIAKIFEEHGFYVLKDMSIYTSDDKFVIDIIAICDDYNIILCKLVINDVVVSDPLTMENIEEFKKRNGHAISSINDILGAILTIDEELIKYDSYEKEIPYFGIGNVVIFMNNNIAIEVDIENEDEEFSWTIDFNKEMLETTLIDYLKNVDIPKIPPKPEFLSFVLELFKSLEKNKAKFNRPKKQ